MIIEGHNINHDLYDNVNEKFEVYIIPFMSGSEVIGTGPHKLTQKLFQSKLLKNSRKR